MTGKKYIDIHSHILPGVDDGAKSMEESLAMLRQAQKENIGIVIVTPHQKPDRRCVSIHGIQAGMEQLKNEMRHFNVEVELYPGSELLYCHELGEKLEAGSVSTLAGSRYALVEFLPAENWQYMRCGLYELVCKGYFPVIAHVERYSEVAHDPERVQELIDMGCYIQVNAGSITGSAGFGTKRAVKKLLKEQMVHFVATDAHRQTGSRSVQLEGCSAYLRKKCGPEYAELLLRKNAECILTDTEL